MAKGKFFRRYELLSREDQGTFDRWLQANAIVGLLLAAAFVAMALAGARSEAPRDAMVADGAKASHVIAAGRGDK
jgi:hypothetical protein